MPNDKKNNQIPVRINFQLKENQLPQLALSGIDRKIDLSSATRLFSSEDKLRQSNLQEKFSEKAFNQLYEKMDEAEKSLYRIWYIDLKDDADVDGLLKDLKENPNIQFAEIDELNNLHYNSNDAYYPQMYGLHKTQANCAWDKSEGKDIVVAVLDTGVNYNHPDIKNNMWQNGSGHYGYDFSDNDTNPIDYHGHGSHVAGTIAAIGNNNIGIIGVAPKAKIMAVKIFPNAYDSKIAQALKYAVDNGAKVLNNSWGPSSRRPSAPVLEAAVNYVYSKGGVCVFAAGNSNDDVQYYSPANMPTTIAVAATDSNDDRASFSNWGSKIDIAAPGVNIMSLRHNNSGYRTMSGTSMAAPHVSGAIALLLSKAPHLHFNRVSDVLKKTSDKINPDKYIGKGRLNLCKMLGFNPPIRIKRSSIVETEFGGFSINNQGQLVNIKWTNSGWVANIVPTWGAPIVPSSLISIGGGFIAAVNKDGRVVVTYGTASNIQYAVLNETVAIIPGTLRFSLTKFAIFALDLFGDIQYIKYYAGQWSSSTIQTWGAKIVPESIELSRDGKIIYGVNEVGVASVLWEDPSQLPFADGTKLAYAEIGQTSNLAT